MQQVKRHLFWFTRDLRTHDQAALAFAADNCDELLCVYCLEPWYSANDAFATPQPSDHRQQFLAQSLMDLDRQLDEFGQRLLVLKGNAITNLGELIQEYRIERVVRSQLAGHYEQRVWSELKSRSEATTFDERVTHTLFTPNELPFELADLPPTFTRFRKRVEELNLRSAAPDIDRLPPPPANFDFESKSCTYEQTRECSPIFSGGTSAGKARLTTYFEGTFASHYKEVRNALDGINHSTKFSVWLADGSLSPLDVMHELREYERRRGANESTYWIFFELLWREFFQWHAHQQGARMFHFSGAQSKRPLTSFYPQRFQQWTQGTTPFPLVNAIMNELRSTGYISNRARQIAASCFINELSMDWRYGAQWFERQLIDYDVASNWGNWQYLAGVGADVQPRRHFNLEKQTQQFDPKGEYIRRWRGNDKTVALDSVDAADWPT